MIEYKDIIKILKDKGVELTQEQLKLLNKKEQFVPKLGEMYWFVNTYGKVTYQYWDNDGYDNTLLERGIVFRTEEEAQKHADKLNFLNWYENEIKENSDDIDWDNSFQDKHYIYYNHRRESLATSIYITTQAQGVTYSTNVGHLKKLIEEHGAEIKKHVFEVEE